MSNISTNITGFYKYLPLCPLDTKCLPKKRHTFLAYRLVKMEYSIANFHFSNFKYINPTHAVSVLIMTYCLATLHSVSRLDRAYIWIIKVCTLYVVRVITDLANFTSLLICNNVMLVYF